MKSFHVLLAHLALVVTASAALQPGDSLKPYEVKSSRTGQEYCPICTFTNKTIKIVAFGKLKDAAFWEDLEKLQALAGKYPNLGVFAQVIDSEDLTAIKTETARHGIKFQVVVPVESTWDNIYQVKGVSRTLYYAKKENEIAWSTVGLAADSAQTLSEKLAADFAG